MYQVFNKQCYALSFVCVDQVTKPDINKNTVKAGGYVTSYHSAAIPMLFSCFSAASFPFIDNSLLGA